MDPPRGLGFVDEEPLHRLLALARLGSAGPRIVCTVLITWLPLVALSAANGLMRSGSAMPLASDTLVHVALLVAMPLLIAAEHMLDARLAETAEHLCNSGLVDPAHAPRMAATLARIRQLRCSKRVLAGLCACAWIWSLESHRHVHLTSWYAPTGDRLVRSSAGWWYAAVSEPLFLLLVLQWVWRAGLWFFFLWRLSRSRLCMSPLHPDRAGGLGTLGAAQVAFAPLVLAISAVWAAAWRNQIRYQGDTLKELSAALASFGAIEAALLVGPLLFFAPSLHQLRVRGMRDYGSVGGRYARLFEDKWMGASPPDAELLGTQDLQALADLGGSYEHVRDMLVVPIDKKELTALVAAALIPVLVLLGFVLPVADVVRGAFSPLS